MTESSVSGRSPPPLTVHLGGKVSFALLIGAILVVGHGSIAFSSGPPSADFGSSVVGLSAGGTNPSAAGSESSICATINSNASLNSTYNGIYSGLTSESGNSTGGSNSTAPLGQSGYPNETTGDRQLIGAWVSICDSAAFTALYDEWGPRALKAGPNFRVMAIMRSSTISFTTPRAATRRSKATPAVNTLRPGM